MSTLTREQDYYILKVSSPGARGIIAAVSNFLADRGCNIIELAEFDDLDSGRFFMRTVFHTDTSPRPNHRQLCSAFEATGARFDMDWDLYDATVRPRILILVSRTDHCLYDLLYRHRTGELRAEIGAVVSNHPDLGPLAAQYGIRFVHLPVTPETKAAQEAQLSALIEEIGTDLVVLARYMQILSPELCARLKGRAINIHHSFLPGFKGARPYHQAYERGVKLIGATAHYVTDALDEGPIIEQVIERVDHTYRPEHLVRAGRDSEKLALARAVRYHLEHRVFVNGAKTVVFR